MSVVFQLQKQLDMMETEYKLVDKTRVKALQVRKYIIDISSLLSKICTYVLLFIFKGTIIGNNRRERSLATESSKV